MPLLSVHPVSQVGRGSLQTLLDMLKDSSQTLQATPFLCWLIIAV